MSRLAALRTLRATCALTFVALVASFAQEGELPAPRSTDEPALATPAPLDDGNVHTLERWNELACASCHTAIAQEWASTRHATAWIHERYQEELADKRRPESCHGCHIPVPLHLGTLGKRPEARLADPHFGITCESCHLGENGVILGPFGAPTSAHASRRSESFLPEGESKLCISCHATTIGPVIGIAKDFVESKQSAKGRSCVGCHMAPVERPIANAPGAGANAPGAGANAPGAGADVTAPAEPPPEKRSGRSHALQTPRDPAFLRRAFQIEARAHGRSVLLVVENRCGHRVPGLIERSIRFEAELLDAKDQVLARGVLEIDERQYLPVDGKRELLFDDPGGKGELVRVRGLHDAPGFAKPATFQEGLLEVQR